VEAGSVLAQLRHRLKVSGPRAELLDVLVFPSLYQRTSWPRQQQQQAERCEGRHRIWMLEKAGWPASTPDGSSGGTCSTLARLQMNTTRSPAAARLCAKWKRMDVLPLRTSPRLSRRMVACAGVKNRKRCSDKACAACTARCRMLLTAWESAALLRAKIVYAYEIIELHLRTGPVTRQCSKCAGKAGRFRRSACKRTSCPADKKSLRCRTMPNPLLGPLGCEPQLRC